MPRGHEFAVGADQLGKPSPHFARATRKRQLGEMPALLAHAAEIDAARLRSQRAFFQQTDAEAVAAEVECCGASGDAAADDRDIDAYALRHRGLDHGSGIGLTGGCARKRPTAATSCRDSVANSSAAAALHIRP